MFNSRKAGILFGCLTIFFSFHVPAHAESLAACETLLSADKAVLASAEAFRKYFSAIDDGMVERTETIRLIEVALLAREHVLLMGPPGNAKSMISDAILGSIVESESDKPSYYRIQMTPETTMSETHGPISPKEIFDSGRILRHYDQGMLFSRNVFIDEIFDARANAQRNILGLLAERQHAQGTEIVQGKIETVVGATNRYLDEVYEKAGDQGPKALLDRFGFNIYVPGEFQFANSYHRIIGLEQKAATSKPKFTFAQLDALRALTAKVELPKSVVQFLSLLSYRMKIQSEAMEQSALKIYRKKLQNGETPPPPYRATKYHSPRTLYKASRMLRAFVVRDWIEKGGKRSLTATVDDLNLLKSFFVLSGPGEEFTQGLLERTVNPYERSQLSAIQTEAKLYDDSYTEIAREMNEIVYKYALVELDSEVAEARDSGGKDQILEKLTQLWLDASTKSSDVEQAKQTGHEIGYALVSEFIEGKIQSLAPEDYKSVIKSKLKDIEQRKVKEAEEERRRIAREAAEKRQREIEAQAAQRAQERRARVDAYMSAQVTEALGTGDKHLELLGEVRAPNESQPTPGSVQRSEFHVRLADQSLIFTPGKKGFRIGADGKVTEIIYEDVIPDQMLREVLGNFGERRFVAIDGKRFAVQRGSILMVVNAETFKVERMQMLALNEQFLFDQKGKYGFEISVRRNQMRKIELLTGKDQSEQLPNLANYQGHIGAADIAWVQNDETVNFTYQGIAKVLLTANIRTKQVATPHLPLRGLQCPAIGLATGKSVIGVYPHGNQYLVANLDAQDPLKATDISLAVPPGHSAFASSNLTVSPDGRHIALVQTSGPGLDILDLETKQSVSLALTVPDMVYAESLTWIDAQTVVYKTLNAANVATYQIYRIKPPSQEKLEAIAAGE